MTLHTLVEVQNQAFLVSLRAIVSHIDEIMEGLRQMQAGERPVDYALLRQLAMLCQQLPPKDAMPKFLHASQTVCIYRQTP